MTLKEVSKATKIRVSILAALENEEWEKLPQRIFIKGFVRAYAKAVGAEEGFLLDLFESSCPVKDATISCPPFEIEPMRDLNLKKRHYGWIVVLGILVVILGLLYFVYVNFSGVENRQGKAEHEETTVVSSLPQKSEQKPETPSQQPQNPPGLAASKTQTESETHVDATAEMKPATETEVTGSESPQKGADKSIAPPISQKKKPNVEEEPPPKLNKEKEEKNLVVKAKMETWIGVKIDGKTRKEKLLKAGETFSERVEKYVELLIGNAGGVEITFNGEKIEGIGKPGQVVRLRLPRRDAQQP